MKFHSMVSEGLLSVKLGLMPNHGMTKISEGCTAQVGPIDRITFSQQLALYTWLQN